MITWYEAVLNFRNRNFLPGDRNPYNFCEECLLRSCCHEPCEEILTEILGDSVNQIGMGADINAVKKVLSKSSLENLGNG